MRIGDPLPVAKLTAGQRWRNAKANGAKPAIIIAIVLMAVSLVTRDRQHLPSEDPQWCHRLVVAMQSERSQEAKVRLLADAYAVDLVARREQHQRELEGMEFITQVSNQALKVDPTLRDVLIPATGRFN